MFDFHHYQEFFVYGLEPWGSWAHYANLKYVNLKQYDIKYIN